MEHKCLCKSDLEGRMENIANSMIDNETKAIIKECSSKIHYAYNMIHAVIAKAYMQGFYDATSGECSLFDNGLTNKLDKNGL